MTDLYTKYAIDRKKYIIIERTNKPYKSILLIILFAFLNAFIGYEIRVNLEKIQKLNYSETTNIKQTVNQS